MDAQSQMNMGQTQQIVFLVQTVGQFFTQFSVQYCDTSGFIHYSVVLFQSCGECAYVRTLVVRLDFTILCLSVSFVIFYLRY